METLSGISGKADYNCARNAQFSEMPYRELRLHLISVAEFTEFLVE